MADNQTSNTVIEYATKQDLNSVDKRLTRELQDNRENIREHTREIARLDAVYKHLEGLPLTIANLDKTITIISGNLESMDRNLTDVKTSVQEQEQAIKEIKAENSKQTDDIKNIDNKSKIDIMLFVKDNFWKVLSALAVGYALIEIILKRGL